MRRSRRLWDKTGVTFIELLFAVGMMGLVAAGVYQLLLTHLQDYRSQQALTDHQQNGRIGLATLTREIRSAGFGLLDSNPSAFVGGPPCHPWTSSWPYELVNGESIRFLSSLHGIRTYLDQDAISGDTELAIPDDSSIQEQGLAVSRGKEFGKNDILYLYRLAATPAESGESWDTGKVLGIECHKLTSSGSSGRIRLAPGDSVKAHFPTGSPIYVVNVLHYYLDSDKKRLMRRLDDTTDVLAEGVEEMAILEQQDHMRIRLLLIDDRLHAYKKMHVFETAVSLRNE